MRVKSLVLELQELVKTVGVEGWHEFRTPDRTRIDFAITQGSRRLLAIEFERSRKWLFARVLYNSVKAHRAEFPAILFVYPFYDLPRAGRSWVPNYVEDILGLRLALCHPRDCLSATRALIHEQLKMPVSSDIIETDNVITTTTTVEMAKPASLKVGAMAWKTTKPRSKAKKQKKRRTSKPKERTSKKSSN
ncbi:MAG: hypothetical protein ACFFD8_09410 [Candidatus Thorarchaeota archaeon]